MPPKQAKAQAETHQPPPPPPASPPEVLMIALCGSWVESRFPKWSVKVPSRPIWSCCWSSDVAQRPPPPPPQGCIGREGGGGGSRGWGGGGGLTPPPPMVPYPSTEGTRKNFKLKSSCSEGAEENVPSNSGRGGGTPLLLWLSAIVLHPPLLPPPHPRGI